MCRMPQLISCSLHLSYEIKKLEGRCSFSLGICWMPASGKGWGKQVNTPLTPVLLRALLCIHDA